jgi:aryl-alcohol dehydrogenase
METTAAVLRGGHDPFLLETVVLDEPHAGEVVVEIAAVGLCHTDLLMRELPPEFFPGPRVMGHEGAGVVTAVGAGVTKVAVGDHVVLSFASCGVCDKCRNAQPAYCHDFALHNLAATRPDGTCGITDTAGEALGSHWFGQSSFGRHALVAERSVVKVDPQAPLELLGPLGCGIQTGAGAVMNSLAVPAGASLVVFGTGAVGLAAIMAGHVVGANPIIGVDRHAARLELARELGATHTIGGDADAVAEVRALTGRGADYAIDTTGNMAVVQRALACLHTSGVLGLIGVLLGELTVDASLVLMGRSIRGIIEGDSVPELFIPRLIALWQAGRFPFDRLVTSYPFDQINQAVEDSLSGQVIKPVLRFTSP